MLALGWSVERSHVLIREVVIGALLLAINVRNSRWRWLFVLFAALMPFVAVAGGEHNSIDMIAAIPFMVLVQKLAKIQCFAGRRRVYPRIVVRSREMRLQQNHAAQSKNDAD
jgi:hypothetical protein